MLLVLEDNPDKIVSLIQRYRERVRSQPLISVCSQVRDAQFIVENIVKADTEVELWLDDDLGPGESGYDFLIWLLERIKITFLLIVTLSRRAKDKMEELAKRAEIPYHIWGGPFS